MAKADLQNLPDIYTTFSADDETAFIIDDTGVKKKASKAKKKESLCPLRQAIPLRFQADCADLLWRKKRYSFGFEPPWRKSLKGKTDNKQYVKPRKSRTVGAQRAKEHALDKLTNALKMFGRAIKKGLKTKYVIFDGW